MEGKEFAIKVVYHFCEIKNRWRIKNNLDPIDVNLIEATVEKLRNYCDSHEGYIQVEQIAEFCKPIKEY